MTIDLIGYTDRLSARPGETLDFKVSCKTRVPVKARLFRSISADANPSGIGIVERCCDDLFAPLEFEGKEQKFTPGSHAVTAGRITYAGSEKVEFFVTFKPTMLSGKPQTIMSLGSKEITLDGEGQVCWTVASNKLVAPAPITLNKWYKIAAKIDAFGRMTLRVDQIRNSTGDESVTVEAKTDMAPALDGTLFLAARQ